MTPKMYLDIGIKLVQQGDATGAITAFCHAISLDANYSPAYNNLGLLLYNTQRPYEAEACFRRAIDLSPDDALPYNNLGLTLMGLNYFDKAEDCFVRALELNPGNPEIHNNLGTLFVETYRLPEAKAAYCRALELNPYYPEAYYNMGLFLRLTKNIDEAAKYLRQATELRPAYLEAELALTLLSFLRGEFEPHWDIYEKARLKRCEATDLNIPFWQGENLTTSSILLFWEYGFGDTLQFVRYTQKIEKMAAKTTLWVQEPLQRLLQSTYPSLTVYVGENPPQGSFDFACSLLSLPARFATTNATIPAPVPYQLTTAMTSTTLMKTTTSLIKNNRYNVGVVWAGNPKHLDDQNRSIAFAVFASLFSISNVNWISLQVGLRAADLVGTPHNVLDCTNELVDFMETATLIDTLDLVITVDSAVAHLAATMGKKTWVLLSYDADWRWQLEREDSPWYKTIRLFRQHQLNDWPEVLERVKGELQFLTH